MKDKNAFDCVDMKRKIQEKLTVEERDLSVNERNCEAQRRGLADPVMGSWLKKLVGAGRQTNVCVAEAPPTYGKPDS